MKTKFMTHGITRPTWLGEGWEDHSYGNDAMPHAVLFITDEEEYPAPAVEVWVNYAQKTAREVPPRFMVTLTQESGDDVTLYSGDDEAAAVQFARGAEIAKTIIADILANPVVTTSRGVKANLLDAQSFSELHDYCDANVLGDSEKLLDEFGAPGDDEVMDDVERDRRDQEALDKAVDILNHAQDIVDRWLKMEPAERPVSKKKFKKMLADLKTGDLSRFVVPPPGK